LNHIDIDMLEYNPYNRFHNNLEYLQYYIEQLIVNMFEHIVEVNHKILLMSYVDLHHKYMNRSEMNEDNLNHNMLEYYLEYKHYKN
jgi:hypothetical protein